MFTKLDIEIADLLCCALCHGSIRINDIKHFICADCGTVYPFVGTSDKEKNEYIYDFRLNRPPYCIPEGIKKWAAVQHEYERYREQVVNADELNRYLDEIDSVREIYEHEFHITGSVLDVGGHQGRLRHYLSEHEVPLYLSVDPYITIFENIQCRPNLLNAYSCLNKPCNFLACYAENLPIVSNTFDWVHMRSVLDHFYDPYLAVKEAYRVLKADGTLLIGLTVHGGKSSLTINNDLVRRSAAVHLKIQRTFKQEGMIGLINALKRKLKGTEKENDDHMFHWNYDDLINLLQVAGFIIVKEHWQKEPFSMCIYFYFGKSK